jgi:hypothetical protein
MIMFKGSPLLLGLLLTGCASAISGQVKNTSGDIVKHADARINVVRLDAPESPTPLILSVDEKGQFGSGSVLDDGSYIVEILVPGYKSSSQKVDLKGSKELSFTLVPLKTATTSSFKVQDERGSGVGEGGALLTPPQM